MRQAVIYSPVHGIIHNSHGPIQSVWALLEDAQANEPGAYPDCVVVRLPRRLVWDRWSRRLRARRPYERRSDLTSFPDRDFYPDR